MDMHIYPGDSAITKVLKAAVFALSIVASIGVSFLFFGVLG